MELPTGKGPVRGVVIGGLVLLSGTVTAALVDNPILPALVAAVVLLGLLVVEDLLGDDE